MSTPLLEIRDLVVEFPTQAGAARVVDSVSLSVGRGESVGLVGESGCGKSAIALSVLQLLPQPGRVASGAICFEEQDLLQLDPDQLRRVRGRRIGMVFQEPMTALNPTMRVGAQLAEGMRLHHRVSRQEGRTRVLELLTRLGIPDAEQCHRAYPHQLSGGMQQRALLAMALICEPQLLIADEPTTALDVTLQAEVMELLAKAREDAAMGLLLVTHDLALVAQSCHRMVVLYAGQVVERGEVARCFAEPAHPYTAALLATVHSLAKGHQETLQGIPGSVPSPLVASKMKGCRFADRCTRAEGDCHEQLPTLESLDRGGAVRCLHPLAAKDGAG